MKRSRGRRDNVTVALLTYRSVLSVRGSARLFAVNLLTRLPICASGMVLTLHVVLGLRHSFTEAGLAGASTTVGIAVGAPLMGKVLDSYGLRVLVCATALAEGIFWSLAWMLPYHALLIAAFVSGVLVLPAVSIGRQAVAALVPRQHRRAALSLDSICIEITYMIGPAVGVLLATKISTMAAMFAVGATMLLAGAALFVLNPAVLHEDDHAASAANRPRVREWLHGDLSAMLWLSGGTMFVLCGAELAMVAALSKGGQIEWTGVVVGVGCVASAVGGLVYGALHRPISPMLLMAVLGGLTIPVGMVGNEWWLLALVWIPSNLACAPAIAAMNEQVMHLAPVKVRGIAMGFAASATTLGLAISSPLIGFVVDHYGPVWAFVVAGVGGLVSMVIAAGLQRNARQPGVAFSRD